MNLHNHRDASLALSVTSTMFLRSVAKGLSAGRERCFAALSLTCATA